MKFLESNPDRFTDRAKSVLSLSESLARASGDSMIAPEHILAALSEIGCGVGCAAMRRCGFDLAECVEEVQSLISPKEKHVSWPQLALGPDATHVIAYAKDEADRLNHNYVGTEHLVLGLLCHESKARAFLVSRSIHLDDLRTIVAKETSREQEMEGGGGWC